MIAWKEMVRAKVRFGLLIGAIALLVFLILFQQALRDGLITSFVGAIEHQTRAGARLQHRRSAQPAEQLDHARARGAGARCRRRRATSVGSGRARSACAPDGSINGAAVIGYEQQVRSARRSRSSRAATPPPTARASPTRPTRREGFGLGDVVRVEPGGYRDPHRRPVDATPTCRRRPRCSSATARGRTAVQAANPDAQRAAPERARRSRPWPGVSPRAARGPRSTR